MYSLESNLNKQKWKIKVWILNTYFFVLCLLNVSTQKPINCNKQVLDVSEFLSWWDNRRTVIHHLLNLQIGQSISSDLNKGKGGEKVLLFIIFLDSC